MSSGPWFSFLHKASNPRLRLICLHYAGGNAGVFRHWGASIPQDIDLLAVNLPGRTSRFKEPLIEHMDLLVDRLLEAISRERVLVQPQRFALFGHSMGGLIAFELARKLGQRMKLHPDHLIVSGSRAPSLPRKERLRHALPKAEFIAELRRYGGTPEAVFEHDELLETVVPMLRADFAIVETYHPGSDAKVSCPLMVFGGESDPYVESTLLDAWQEHTTAPIDVRLFAGGHFFLQDCEREVLGALSSILGRNATAMAV